MTVAIRVGLTGATGYLGTRLSDYLTDRGHPVVALTRSRPTHRNVQWRRFELGGVWDETLFDNVDILVHAGWAMAGSDARQLWNTNVSGSRILLDVAKSKGVGIIFISSMSAYFGTRQTYGLAKLAVERTALDLGGVVVRPGLIYGDAPGGMAATLTKLSRLPIWPRFRSAKLFLAHDCDIVRALSMVINDYNDFAGQILGFANPTAQDFSTILTALSRTQTRRMSLPVPAAPSMALLRLMERAGATLPFRSDSLLGLTEAATTLPVSEALAASEFKFRALGELNRPDFDGGSGYWISTRVWSVRSVA